MFLLRKLLYHVGCLPAQTAHTLFNYLVRKLDISLKGLKREGRFPSLGRLIVVY